MKDRLALFAYMAAVLLVTSVHDIIFLGVVLGVLVLLAGRNALRIARRATRTIVVFISVVTVSYILVSHWRGGFSTQYVALINLRVFLLAFMTLLLVCRINLLRALSFSKSMQYLFTITYSQTLTFRRLFLNFKMALKSRTIQKLSTGDLYRHGASTGAYFIQKAMNDATEITRAMNSRGFFRAQS